MNGDLVLTRLRRQSRAKSIMLVLSPYRREHRTTAIVVAAPNKKKNPSGVNTVIRQFSMLFSTPFLSCQLNQTAFVYKQEDTELNVVYCVLIFKMFQI